MMAAAMVCSTQEALMRAAGTPCSCLMSCAIVLPALQLLIADQLSVFQLLALVDWCLFAVASGVQCADCLSFAVTATCFYHAMSAERQWHDRMAQYCTTQGEYSTPFKTTEADMKCLDVMSRRFFSTQSHMGKYKVYGSA
eukprot:TRINITY_DN11527_c0_g1_i4.p4 TRINITY_DN11527_c0_g1~~TRINITY_DN11527_c0_g1_i4.p4  ORF type:complete len:140 (+),score=24.27 TRINITY_DN11527_c0_g1_i4:6152-6571(+)